MLFRPFVILMVAFAASLAVAMEAEATSRFSVQNDSPEKVNVYIYTGGDTVCSIHEKLKSVGAGNSNTFGCTGNGKNRCQIQLYADGKQICKKQHNSCFKDNARKMNNGQLVVITYTEEEGYYCSFY